MLRLAALACLIAMNFAAAPPAGAFTLLGRRQSLPARPPLYISPAGEAFRGADAFAAWWRLADRDQDGAISPVELAADFGRVFHALDTDRDGQIEEAEIAAYERGVPELALRSPRGRWDGLIRIVLRSDAARREGAARYALLNDPQPVRIADFDFSGTVSPTEFLAKATGVFNALDRDHDGRIAWAEVTGR